MAFYDTDDEENFRRARKHYGDDWLWSSRPVDYRINAQGFRMAEMAEVDWNNYLAVFGCSFTVGVGMPLEELFSHRIAQELGLDYVNLAQPGASNDLIGSNAMRLFAVKPRPKMMIVNWTSLSRKGFWVNDRMDPHGLGLKNDPMWKSSYQEYVRNQDQWPRMFLEIKRQVDVACSLADVPVWHLTNFTGYDFDASIDKIIYDLDEVGRNINDLDYVDYNLARDVHLDGRWAHPGLGLQHRILKRWNDIKEIYG